MFIKSVGNKNSINFFQDLRRLVDQSCLYFWSVGFLYCSQYLFRNKECLLYEENKKKELIVFIVSIEKRGRIEIAKNSYAFFSLLCA